MALELLHRTTDFYVYRGCDGNYNGFYSPIGAGGMCGTTTKQYYETIFILDSFVYDAAVDRYRFVTWNNIANWPTWEIVASVIHPETGIEEQRIPLVGYAVSHAWTDPAYNAGLGKVVAGYISTVGSQYGIIDVTTPDCIPTATQIANPYVTATQIPNLAGTNQGYALCPEKKLLALVTLMAGNRIQVYDYSAYPSAATMLWEQPFPESFCWGVGYESDQRMWALFSGNIWTTATDGRQSLLKYNYAKNKIELLSELQTAGGADRMTQIAFDTKRKKLAAVRIKADDATTGKHNNAFEIYAPQIAAVKVTVPINLKPLTVNTDVPFVSHVLGSKGEAGAFREVTVSCSPTSALVTTPTLMTEVSGRVEFTLKPTVAGSSETLVVTHVDDKVLT